MPRLYSTLETRDETRSLSVASPKLSGAGRRERPRVVENELFGSATDAPTIGRYRVLERVGAGGMGEVFAAYDLDLDRKVAVKLVHSEVAEESSTGGARLLREAQTLAKVSHPNVVHVYEVGTVGGRLFIAMEFIRGQTLRKWCMKGRTHQEIIEVLIQAGRGLQAVHEAGLVHRDFKPDNVLVGDDGRICVADFGLARSAGTPTVPREAVAEPEAAASVPEVHDDANSRLTASGAIVGTPVYMAPEQLRARAIDARCDQFSFCVSLWELLADVRPFVAANMPDLVEAHRSSIPAPPQASPVPTRVWAALQRGLSMDPAERFADMRGLLDALEPPRRRRFGGLLGVGGVAFLVGALAFAQRGAAPCEDAASSVSGWDDAEADRVVAAIEATEAPWARATAFDLRNRLDAHARSMVVERTAACEATRVAGTQSETRLDLRVACLDRIEGRFTALTEALQSVTPEGVEHASRAAERLPEPGMCRGDALETGMAPPANGTEAAAIERVRRSIDGVWALLSLGSGGAADAAATELVQSASSIEYDPLRAEVALVRGEIERALGRYDPAREQFLLAADLAEGSRHDRVAADAWTSLTRLAWLNDRDVDAARARLRRARAAAQRLGNEPRRARELLRQEAAIDRIAGDLESAREKLEILADGPSGLEMFPALAGVLWAQGELDSAYVMHERHRQQLQDRVGPDHPKVGSAHFNLGALDVERGNTDSARTHLARARQIWERAYGPLHPRLAQVHVALQNLDMNGGDLAAAQRHAEAALRIAEATLPPHHPEVGQARQALAAAAFLRGDLEAAVESYEVALSIQESGLGESHRETAVVRANLAEALLAMQEPQRAIASATRAVRDLDAAGANPALISFAQRVLGSAHLQEGSSEQALAALTEARDRMPKGSGNTLEGGVLFADLARALQRVGRVEDAAAAAEQARSTLRGTGAEAAQDVLRQLDVDVPKPASSR